MKQALAGFEDQPLPVMPSTLAALRRLLQADNSDNLALQRVLLRDPAASIALYRRLQQSRPGAWENIATPAHALSMIGREPFAELVEELTTASDQTLDDLLSPAYAYSQSAHAAVYAQALSEQLLSKPDDEISVAALLQNPAILALWRRDGESAARASNAVRDGVPLDLAFGAELGESLEAANRRLAERWFLPRLARDAISDWNPFNRRLQLVGMASMLATAEAAGWNSPEAELQAEILEEMLQTDVAGAHAWWHRQAGEAARRLHGLGYPLPAFNLLLLPGDEPEVEIPVLPSHASRPASPATNLHELIAETLGRMRSETGIGRAVFAMLNRERTELRARLALGGAADQAICRFRLRTAERNLFSLLLAKQQSIWINPDNRTKYAAYLRQIPLDKAANGGFFAMSIFVRDKPLGLVYADGDDLSEQTYREFRKLCQQIGQQLSGERAAA